MLVDLSAAQPTVTCGVKLPGRVNKFFYYQGHLVVMTESQQYGASRHSYLLHFSVAPNEIRLVSLVYLAGGGACYLFKKDGSKWIQVDSAGLWISTLRSFAVARCQPK